jgi:hypothetical protein
VEDAAPAVAERIRRGAEVRNWLLAQVEKLKPPPAAPAPDAAKAPAPAAPDPAAIERKPFDPPPIEKPLVVRQRIPIIMWG